MNNNWMGKPRSRREALQSIMGVGGMTLGAGMLAGCASSTDAAQADANRKPFEPTDPQQRGRSPEVAHPWSSPCA